MGVTANRGRNMFVLLTRNETERAAGAQVIKRKYMKLRTIFGDKPFKLGKDTYYPRFVS